MKILNHSPQFMTPFFIKFCEAPQFLYFFFYPPSFSLITPCTSRHCIVFLKCVHICGMNVIYVMWFLFCLCFKFTLMGKEGQDDGEEGDPDSTSPLRWVSRLQECRRNNRNDRWGLLSSSLLCPPFLNP